MKIVDEASKQVPRQSRGATTPAQLRATLRTRLEARREEIEEAFLIRIFAISEPDAGADPQYADGLRGAVAAALDFGLAGIENGEERIPSLPLALLAQARLAARCGVGLDTVLRRYFAGYALLVDFVVREVEQDNLFRDVALRGQLRAGAAAFDRLVTAVSDEYFRERSHRLVTSEQLRAEQIERLLAGEPLDTSRLRYDFDAFHLGLAASGEEMRETMTAIAGRLNRRLLVIQRPDGMVWAWLGGRRPAEPEEACRLLAECCPPGGRIALGEPGAGLAGWRTTHRQAAAAMSVVLRRERPIVRYADVASLASALQDDLLAISLRDLYLAPLERDRDNGVEARRTLRAYFAASRNVSSAAAALGLSRQAVNSRLRAIEDRIGRRIDDCVGELETALEMEELRAPSPATSALDRCQVHGAGS